MAMTVFKAQFSVRKGSVTNSCFVKTITIDPEINDLQYYIDRIIAQLEKEGYTDVYLNDIKNISTPIIRKKY